MRPTKEQIGAYLAAIKAIADTIREVGECPLGSLYVPLMSKMDLDCFNGIIRKLESAGLIEVSGASLAKWTGPEMS